MPADVVNDCDDSDFLCDCGVGLLGDCEAVGLLGDCVIGDFDFCSDGTVSSPILKYWFPTHVAIAFQTLMSRSPTTFPK